MAQKDIFPKRLIEFHFENGVLEVITDNGVRLRVEFYTSDIVRFRYSTENYFHKDFSYALDPDLEKEEVRLDVDEEGDHIFIKSESLVVQISKNDLHKTISDSSGKVILIDEKGFHWEKNYRTSNDIVKMSKKTEVKEHFYGLGDKTSDFNLKGGRFKNWGSDCYGYNKDWDPLYKNIPFYYGLKNNTGYGVFFDNSFKTFFDFGKERKDAASFWAHGGEMNYYFIGGPRLIDVAKRYAHLTGTHDLPALWSLGFQQCKWSYYPESQVREVTRKMREYRIPCDAIYLDIDYMDGFRCFTWDKEKFPNPKKMVSDFKEEGFQTVVIIDPGIKKDHNYWVFREGLESGYFCKRQDGPYIEGKVWPGECYFPDFTNPEVREWWAGLYKELIAEIGISGVWNDMNEPALFDAEGNSFPDDVRHDYDGHSCSHRKAHNVYGMQMARATYEGVKKHNDGRRGLIISRSGYSGLQRYSSVWTGDNRATWQHIWMANIQCQRLAISGVSFAGSDIGGFIGKPNPEMFIRWIQLAIFHPFCRVHSSQDDGDQEPWSFGEETLVLFREAIELRYQLLLYHYTAFYRHTTEGIPYVIPLVFYDQDDAKTYNKEDEFLCGSHILTASVSSSGASSKVAYLPHGMWYNYWNNDQVEGGQLHKCALAKNRFPLFIKAGAIIPFHPVQQYVDEFPIEVIELKIYFGFGEHTSHLYEDEHDGREYQNGNYRYSTFVVLGDQSSLTIQHSFEGHFRPTYPNFRLSLIGLPFEVSDVHVDRNKIDEQNLEISSDFQKIVIH